MKKSINVLFCHLGIIVSLVCVFLSNLAMAKNSNNAVVKVKVGMVVDYDQLVGRMGLKCIKMALSDLYPAHAHAHAHHAHAHAHARNYTTKLVLHTRNSNSDVVGAAAAALDLIKNEQVVAIMGPVTSSEANFVVELGEQAQVPIISYSATSPTLSRSSYFFRANENQVSQVKAISALVQAFGWKQVVPIYSYGEYGEGLIPVLTDALLEVNARVPYRSVIPLSVTVDQIGEELRKLMNMETRVFIVHTNDTLFGTKIFAKAREIGMFKEGYVWIVTNVMTNLFSSMESSAVRSMNGVLGIKTYVPESKGLKEFRARWKREFKNEELNVFGLWAYDATKALTMAAEKVIRNDNGRFGFHKTKNNNNVSVNSTDLDTFGVSLSGPKLREALLNVRFEGLAGNFSLANRQLQPSTYQIINVVNGSGENVIGFWTPKHGLLRNLTFKSTSTEYNTSKDNLDLIMWPGGSKSIPKGWDIPINKTKLKVGVPMRGGFKEFVDVSLNRSSNTTNVTGFCIEIFEAVMKRLPYNIEYELIPFVNSSWKSNGTYDDLVYQVYLGNFDVAVGDITIRANRSLYVDFTLPYTESGVQMIVPVKDQRSKNAWVFLKPLTWDLWATSASFFVFIGFVVWVLEHRINEDFRGPPLHQIGTTFSFSFSIMVFAYREKVISNMARFVTIIWVFVVLILTQSYTASLTSLLTVQQLQPTVTSVTQLLQNKDNVGYVEGSFVHGMLIDIGFHDSQLKVYKSPEELDEAFSNHTTSSRDQGLSKRVSSSPRCFKGNIECNRRRDS
ncbi:glutamate receptor 2.7-like isoform X2 [Humulus lupulus]|uniref:glutamate receptor 2.7-like isoform X2 n=1 Tax=Humulus lupulus TaxID=3486 RepID=UPI002B4079A4|nr:glutamate receptor 2.7-like isoform X2 [Humulus lupulus]